MDGSLQSRVEVLAREIAGQARTIEDVNELMRVMMKSALERMPRYRNGRASRTPPAGGTVGPVRRDCDDSDRAAQGRARGVQKGSEPSQRSIEKDGSQRDRRPADHHAPRPRRHLRAAVDREISATGAGL